MKTNWAKIKIKIIGEYPDCRMDGKRDFEALYQSLSLTNSGFDPSVQNSKFWSKPYYNIERVKF